MNMVSDPDSGLAARRLQKLVDAGYRPVSSLVLALLRLRVLNILGQRKYVLPRRTVSLTSYVNDGIREIFVDFSVVTTHHRTERSAVTLSAEFYSFFGRKIQCGKGYTTYGLFADPLTSIQRQPVYFQVPKGSFWLVLSLRRQTKSRRIGVSGNLRPKQAKGQIDLTLEQALVSRDRRALEHYYDIAYRLKNRETAKKLLSRMIYLQRRGEDIKRLAGLIDVEQLLTVIKLDSGEAASNRLQEPFNYAEVTTKPFQGSMPLSKWLKSEAIGLKDVCGSTCVRLAEGSDYGLRLLAARFAGKNIVGFNSEVDLGLDIPWLKEDEILSFAAAS